MPPDQLSAVVREAREAVASDETDTPNLVTALADALESERRENERLRRWAEAENAYRQATSRNFAASVKNERWRELVFAKAALASPPEGEEGT
jgi:hypothetical protein